jgi:cytidine deaminase
MENRKKTFPEEWKTLAEKARLARENAYAPYSKFKVGCALEDEKGHVHTGCNVENVSFSLSCCAERAAVMKMVSEGGKKVKRVALVTSSKAACFPCGSCLQVLTEFGSPTIFSMDVSGELFEEQPLDALMPRHFSGEQFREV